MDILLFNGTTNKKILKNDLMRNPEYFRFDTSNYSFIKNESTNSYFNLPVAEILEAKKRVENNEFDSFDDVFND